MVHCFRAQRFEVYGLVHYSVSGEWDLVLRVLPLILSFSTNKQNEMDSVSENHNPREIPCSVRPGGKLSKFVVLCYQRNIFLSGFSASYVLCKL